MKEKRKDNWNWDAAWSTTVEKPCPKEGTLVWLSDIHFPYENSRAVELSLKVIQDIKPFTTILGGDIFDCYSISDFDKDPNQRMDTLQKEFDSGRYLFKEVCSNSKSTLYLLGNHEYRVSKLITKKVPGLSNLRSLNLHVAADLPKEVEVLPYLAQAKIGKVNYTHGDIATSNNVCAAMSRKYPGINLIQGHGHKADIHYQRFGNFNSVYAQAGTLCDYKKARYVNNPNWTTSFIIVDYWTTNSGQQCFHIDHAKIVNNTVLVHGKVYK